MRRTLATVVITLAWLMAVAAPASAHAVSGTSPTNFRTRLGEVTPSVRGLEVKVIDTGDRLQLENGTGREVIVLGYEGEPYLRIGPDGVFENRRSPATYLNRDRRATTPVPTSADRTAAPEWEKVSSGQVARWHDHRIHWMGQKDPPPVRREPAQRHVIFPEWKVPVRQGATTVELTGDLVWVPGPSPLPWFVVGAALFAGAVPVALRRGARAVAVLVGLLVAIDVVHTVGIAFASSGSPGAKLARLLSGGYFSVFAWAAGAVAIWFLARRRPEGLYVAGLAGALIALFGGVADLTALSRSQVPFALSPWVARFAVAASIGLGLGIVVASVLAFRRALSTEPESSPAAETAVSA